MARPKLEPRAARSIVYGVWLREQEAAALRRIADLVQEPPSRLSREMNAIGRNLNMLVRAIHRGEHVAPADLRRVINAARVRLAVVQDTYRNTVRAAPDPALAPLASGPPRSPSPARTARREGRERP